MQWDAVANPLRKLWYPSQDTLSRLRGSSVKSLGLSDDEAEWINRALCHLKKDRPEQFRLMLKHYYEGHTIRQMEQNGYGDRRYISSELRAGREFIQGALFTLTA